MSIRTCQTLNHLSLLHRPEPIREGLALRCKNPVYYTQTQRKIGGVRSDKGYLVDVVVSQVGLIVINTSEQPFKSP